MNKTDLLLQMMQQPQDYTADEWQEILADDECRELYTLMSKTQSAIDVARNDKEVTDDIIDSEWQRLMKEQTHTSFFTLHSSFLKFAAMFIGVLMLSGIAIAAIHIVRQHQQAEQKKEVTADSNSRLSNSNSQLEVADSIALQPVVYENIPLEKIIPEIAGHYNVAVSFQNDSVRQIRLFYQWKPEYTIEKVVEMLNNFEALQLQLERDTLFVSSTINQ